MGIKTNQSKSNCKPMSTKPNRKEKPNTIHEFSRIYNQVCLARAASEPASPITMGRKGPPKITILVLRPKPRKDQPPKPRKYQPRHVVVVSTDPANPRKLQWIRRETEHGSKQRLARPHLASRPLHLLLSPPAPPIPHERGLPTSRRSLRHII